MAHVDDLWKRKDGSRTPAYGKGMRWRVSWDESGKRKSKSFVNKDAARQHKTLVEHQQFSGAYVTDEYANRTLRDYWPHMEALKQHRGIKTQEQAANAWKHIDRQFGSRKIRSIRAVEIASWLDGITVSTGAKMSHSGRVKLKQALSSLLEMAMEDGVIQVNPAGNVRVRTDPQKPHVFLDAAQSRALMENMPDHYRPLVQFMLNTGLRLGEAVEVRWKDVDLDGARLTVSRTFSSGLVSHTKGRRSRIVPLPSALVESLRARVGAPEGLLFVSPSGGRVNAANFRKRAFYPAVEAAGLPDGTRPHTLRHTYASAGAAAGVPPKVLQEILGHTDIRMTLGLYAGAYGADLDGAAGLVSSFYEA